MSVKELARYIDQSVLKPEFTQEEIRKYIQEGIDFGCITVCINPSSLEIASQMCAGTVCLAEAVGCQIAITEDHCPRPLGGCLKDYSALHGKLWRGEGKEGRER